MPTLSIHQKDALWRIFWTTVQVALPAITVWATKLPEFWVPVGTVALVILKTQMAIYFNKHKE